MGARRRGIFEPSETQITAALIDHWRVLGLPNTLVASIPNAKAHGQPGLTRGLPDLLVLGKGVSGGVGFLELKRDQHAKWTDAQEHFAKLCDELGLPYAVAFGRDQPIRVLEQWGVVRKARAA